MKTSSPILLAILVWFTGLQSVLAQQLPIHVILNGFSLIFGDRRAYFETASAGSFSLSEGQKFNGIKLLSIDTKSGCALIDNRGEQQLLHICRTPDLVLNPAADSGQIQAAAPANLRKNSAGGTSGTPASAPEDTTGKPAQAGVVLTGGGGSGTANGKVANSQDSLSSDSPASDASASNGAGASQTSNPKLYQWWVKEAQKIENARTQTADRVLAGEWPAYPRTPLTSPDANPQLVSGDSLYMDHGPGIIINGQ